MKRLSVLAVLVVCWLAVIAAQEALPARGGRGGGRPTFPPITGIDKVKDNLYYITGAGGLSAVFVTADGVVLIDTKNAGNGQAILDQIKKVTDKPVITIINTHTHGDHTGSNEFFGGGKVEIVVQDNTKANMEKMAALKDNPKAMPTRTFKDKLTLGKGKDEIDLLYLGRAHTDGDAVVVFPALRAMHVGDIMTQVALPFITPANGGSAVELPDTLDKLIKGVKNIDTVLLGHSVHTNTWKDLVEHDAFVHAFVDSVKASKAAGRTVDQAVAELKLPPKFATYISPGPVEGQEMLGDGPSRTLGLAKIIYAELDKK